MGDLRLGFRLLWKDTAFTLTIVLTLTLCIGANVALFSIVHSVLLKPLPVPDSNRIVLMGNAYPGAGSPIPSSSAVPDYFDRLRDMDVFEEQAAYNGGTQSVDQNGTPIRIRINRVTHLQRGGRRGRQRQDGRTQLQPLAITVRRRPGRSWQGSAHRRPTGHGDRCHAEGLLFSEPGRAALASARVHQ